MAIHTSKFLDGSIRINSLFHAKVLILNLMTKGAPCIHKQRNKLSDFLGCVNCKPYMLAYENDLPLFNLIITKKRHIIVEKPVEIKNNDSQLH